MVNISVGEQKFIVDGIELNSRNDGRKLDEFRHIFIETGIIPQANGSAKVKVDNTELIVGVKLEIGEPTKIKPNQGLVKCSVETNLEDLEDLCFSLGRSLQEMYSSQSCLPLKDLCIIPGKQCWILYIDTVICCNSGNLFDVLSFATRAALKDTKIPKITTIQGESEDDPIETEVSDDPEDYDIINLDQTPIFCTLTQIGNKFLIDSTEEEESCMKCKVVFGVNNKGNICYIKQNGKFGLDNKNFNNMQKFASKYGVEMLKKIDFALKKNEKYDKFTHKIKPIF